MVIVPDGDKTSWHNAQEIDDALQKLEWRKADDVVSVGTGSEGG